MTYQLLAEAAAQGDDITWPGALVLVALFALFGFVGWLFFGRD